MNTGREPHNQHIQMKAVTPCWNAKAAQDSVESLILLGHDSNRKGIKNWASYFLSVCNWNCFHSRHHAMDIDGVMTHRGSVLFLEAKSSRDKVVEVMNMDEK